VLLSQVGPVDSGELPPQFPCVTKKPHKVEEPAAPYPAKKVAKTTVPASSTEQPVRYVDPAKARELTKKILDKHSDLFRRLAQ
jgi:hypothetical protein